MAHIGQINKLKVVKIMNFGAYLDGGSLGEILLPSRYFSSNIEIGNEVDVFIYLDSEDRVIATTEKPHVQVGEFGYLRVSDVGHVGAFLDWGLSKDILLPFREQKVKVKQGDFCLVYVFLDSQTQRIVASAKIERFLKKETPPFNQQEKVEALIFKQTDLGYKAIINQEYEGMLFDNEVFQKIEIGKSYDAYVKQIRDDNKIDLTLYQMGYNRIVDFSSTLLEYMKNNDGYTSMTDNSSPEEINSRFGVSKKTFKKAIGDLYKKRMIRIEKDGLYLENIS